MSYEKVYKNRDNTNDFILKADGVAVDLSGVTKMELDFGSGILISSTTSPAVFDWSGGSGGLILAMGGIEDLVVGTGYPAELIIYDATNTDGVNWGTISLAVY